MKKRYSLSKEDLNNDFSRFKFVITLGFVLSLTVQLFISSYSNIRPTEALSYDISDGWCNPNTEGIGSHCFGDFYAPIRALESGNPYESIVSNYPPVAFLAMQPFRVLHNLVPGRTALLV